MFLPSISRGPEILFLAIGAFGSGQLDHDLRFAQCSMKRLGCRGEHLIHVQETTQLARDFADEA